MDFMDLLLAEALAAGLARAAAAERAARPPPDNFYLLPADPQAWRQVHAACKRENMVMCVEVTDDSHLSSRRVQPLFVDLAREVPQIPFFRVKIGFGRTYTQLREDLGGVNYSPTILVVFYDDDGVRICSAEGEEDIRFAIRTGIFKIKIAEFLELRAKLKIAEKLAEQLLADALRSEMEERERRMSSVEYSEQLRRRGPHLSGGNEECDGAGGGGGRGQHKRPGLFLIGGVSLILLLVFTFVYTQRGGGLGITMAGRRAVPFWMGGSDGCRLDEVTSSMNVYQVLKEKVNPEELARCLRFEHQHIETLKDETRKTTSLLSAVLDKWHKGSPPPVCWETIVDAVKCTGDKRLAREIEQQHTH